MKKKTKKKRQGRKLENTTSFPLTTCHKVVKTSLLNSVPTKRESLVAGPPRAQRKAQGKKTKKTKKKEKKM
jgi:hypothetical protein